MINNDETFIRQIKQQLDEHRLDADTCLALQQARIKAMSPASRRRWRMPWLEFAVTASLLTVLALNLPANKPAKAPDNNAPGLVQTVHPRNPGGSATPANAPVKPAAQPTQNKPAGQSVADAELLENLELYEDAEFYQWLSEQPQQGAHDA
jgi:hypothetical protein